LSVLLNTREIVSPSLSSTLLPLRLLLVQNCYLVSLLHPLIFEAFFRGEVSPKLVQSTTDLTGVDGNPSDLNMLRFSPDKLLQKHFVHTLDDGTSYRATVLHKIQDLDAENHANIKFMVELGDGKFDAKLAYGTLSECIEDPEDEYISPEDKVWT
jgi:hypothetical protein